MIISYISITELRRYQETLKTSIVSRARNLESYGFFIMEEIWKEVPETKGLYFVSNLGRFKRIKKYGERILIPSKSANGYMVVGICLNNKNKVVKIHRLVASLFIRHPKKDEVVNHIDFDKSNNRLENLEWVSHMENLSHYQTRRNDTSSKKVGCSYNNQFKKWVAAITLPAGRKYLGLFETETDAHNAYIREMNANGIVNKYAK